MGIIRVSFLLSSPLVGEEQKVRGRYRPKKYPGGEVK